MRTLAQFTLAALVAAASAAVQADAVTDWNVRANAVIADAKIGTPPAIRIMALVQTSVHEAAEAASRQGASVDAAIAAANRSVLARMLPAQDAAIQAAYQSSLATLPTGAARDSGVAAGEQAAAAVLARRADDGAAAPDRYKPSVLPGQYVPTASPAVPHWGQRKPWLLARADQVRPDAPPALGSAAWARDYNEIKSIGSRASTARTAEQTEVARFWEFSLPSIYYGVVRSVATMPGRTPAQNARLFAAVSQAMDDGMIAVFDAKYHYNFWRPQTAIRNGDIDGNAATDADVSWQPLIDAPLHPEYPSAHSILAGSVGTLLEAELNGAPAPVMSTSSPTAKGATRQWTRIADFMNEVANARIYEGIHYRVSTEVGLTMGRKVGEMAAARHLGRAQHAAATESATR